MGKDLNMIIWWESLTSRIDLSSPTCTSQPGKKVFKYTLVKLVEYIQSYQMINIDVWELLPEWVIYWLDTSVCTGFLICFCVHLSQCMMHFLEIPPVTGSRASDNVFEPLCESWKRYRRRWLCQGCESYLSWIKQACRWSGSKLEETEMGLNEKCRQTY